MAELKRRRNRARENGQKFLQKRSVYLHIRRQLKQQRTELFRTRDGLNRAQKARDEILCRLQALDMRDDLVRFDTEAKSGGSSFDPFLCSRLFQQLAESKVDLNGVQLRRIVLQKFC